MNDLKKLHTIFTQIKNAPFGDNSFEYEENLRTLLKDIPYIKDISVKIPIVFLKSTASTDFLSKVLGIPKNCISCEIVTKDAGHYIIECQKIEDFIEEAEDKCEVIELAEEEFKDFDDTDFGKDFNHALSEAMFDIDPYSQYHKREMELEELDILKSKILNKKPFDDIQKYLNIVKKRLCNNRILDIRLEGMNLYIKAKKYCTIHEIATLFDVEQKYVHNIPINSKYKWVLIEIKEKTQNDFKYNSEKFLDYLYNIGSGDIPEKEAESFCDGVIRQVLEEKSSIPNNTYIRCNIEDRVISIGINYYNQNIKEDVSNALGLPINMFIEVSGPSSSVLLIDTYKIYLIDYCIKENFIGE